MTHRWTRTLLLTAVVLSVPGALPGARSWTVASERSDVDASHVQSDYFIMEFPPESKPGELERGRRILAFLESLRADIDAALIEARVLSRTRAKRKPAKRDLWKVRYFADEGRCREYLAQFDERLAEAPCNCFWHGPEFPDTFTTLYPYGSQDNVARDLLGEGAKQILFERIGVDCVFRAADCGIPLQKGFVCWLRNSFRPRNSGYPRVLGGCPPTIVQAMKTRIEAGTFPTIDELFEAPQERYDDEDHRLYWAAVLLVEFLVEGGKAEPELFYRHLASHKRISGRAGAERGKAAFWKAYRRLGTPEEIEQAFRSHVLKWSEPCNRKKLEQCDEPRGAG